MIIAKSPVKSPILKSITKGIKITNNGIVCKVSFIGLTIADTTELCAAHIPNDVPTIKQNTTAIPQR